MFEFHPKRLTEVLKKVRENHADRRGCAPEIGKSVVDEVREILSQAETKDLNNIIFRFDSKRLLACIEIVAVDREGDVADKAAHAVRMRPKEAMIPIAWFKLLNKYPHSLLEFLLRDLVTEKGGKVIENNPNISNHAIRWLMDSNLTKGILKDYRSAQETFDFDKFLKGHFLSNQESLYEAAWQNLLMKGLAIDIRKQSPGRILEVMEMEIKSANSIQMGQNYLNMLRNRSVWDESILIYINNKWGRPLMESSPSVAESRFWEGVSQPAREEFHKWLMLIQIDDFFEGERADFWRAYVEQSIVKTVEKILEGKGFILVFDRFGVIEFKDKGNAAYIYPLKEINEYRRDSHFRSFTPAYYKKRKKTIHLASIPTWDGRIIHHAAWQADTKTRINRALKEL